MNTTLYVFNENGIISSSELESFCLTFEDKTIFNFAKYNKDDIDLISTIFKKFSTTDLDYIIYDHGYVMKIEGDIKKSVLLLKELDEVIDNSISYYVSPTQRIKNSEQNRYPRGASERDIAQFLDAKFNNSEYTSALKDIS